ncbi:styrene monooxygenase/indole monooxygenase family protein [Paeniglutamicibacter cryotolerans]|uniref:2-polyprenyl-6-methoxyphenol hydroxylase-like FAD-dependent oxidoreductase n=1 Tax=Paeniglutamicibacter cryotolerans TaxID=670079 RepID=A0A839QJ54_9MICC|nr:styrene monooxygenase/indole monooxygenase family protein [Paeniglutamicibacter cryotolerans]MBB2996219.1 2-polyprenyl-6-methoxyphenol hydroxylase-like FAD-dependent oxidoreductase [Paeniglutamicibacter cryotolerans]
MAARSITIVGAGQSGLQLGIGLLDAGFEVTLVSNRTPEQIRDGSIASSQCMFDQALGHERALGLDLWPDAPVVEGIGFTVAPPEAPGVQAMGWSHRLDSPAQSIDQRVKYPAFMEVFEARGGTLLIEDAGVAELERYAQASDLVIVAAGKGEVAGLFTRDDQRSHYAAPQRALALTYVHGMKPREEYSAVNFNLIPGVGEYFVFPALTLSGPCEIMVFEGLPGSDMDSWKGLTPQEHLENSLRILNKYLPWEAARCTDVKLTDTHGILQGRFAPTVRHPLATLPSGRTVLGMADVVVLNDPITGQGSNNAAKCAAAYLEGIIEHGEAGYDDAFKQGLFESYWDYAQHVAGWTNAMLSPPPEHVLQVLGAAQENPQIAQRFANGFDYPPDFAQWFMTPDAAQDYLGSFNPVH